MLARYSPALTNHVFPRHSKCQCGEKNTILPYTTRPSYRLLGKKFNLLLNNKVFSRLLKTLEDSTNYLPINN